MTPFPISRIKGLLIVPLLLLVSAGCAGKKEYGYIELVPPEKAATPERMKAGYVLKGDEWTFNHKLIAVTVAHLNKGKQTGLAMIDELVMNNYIVLRMEIENKSPLGKVLFNPSLTVLTDDSNDFRKPLDYTDLYELITSADMPNSQARLKEAKDSFYDMTTTVKPGGKVAKLLVFSPLEKHATKIDLAIKDIYIGTNSLRLSFPFRTRFKKTDPPAQGPPAPDA